MASLRLLLGDDHTLVRQGLRKLLEENPDWKVIAEAGDGREAVRHALELRPDISILDIAMPLLNGIDATRQIVKRWPEARILMLSMHATEPYITRSLQAGAKGYLLKDAAGKDLIRAVSTVAAGKAFFSRVIADSMLEEYVKRVSEAAVADPYDSLSDREREVFQLIAEGYSNKDAATILSISPATVETHRARILEKLDVHNTAELVLFAVRRGVIS